MAKKRKGTYQTGRSNKKVDRRISAKPPGKRKGKGGKLYYERRKNRSDMPGTMEGLVKTKKKLGLKVKLKKLPKRPKASASTKSMETYLKRAAAIKSENKDRISLAKEIQKV